MKALHWLILHGYATDLEQAWRRAEEETRIAITREWPAITVIAERLLIYGRLDAATVAEIVGQRGAA
jgi:hypothetical protein